MHVRARDSISACQKEVFSVSQSHLGAPAVQRFTEELSGGDEHGEQHEDDGRVLAVQSVDDVVVETELEAAQLQRRADKALHCDAAARDDDSSTATCTL